MTEKNLIWLSRLETGKDTMFISAIRKKVNILLSKGKKAWYASEDDRETIEYIFDL